MGLGGGGELEEADRWRKRGGGRGISSCFGILFQLTQIK